MSNAEERTHNGETSSEVSQRWSHALHTSAAYGRTAVTRVREICEEHPLAAAAGALLGGYILGRLFRESLR